MIFIVRSLLEWRHSAVREPFGASRVWGSRAVPRGRGPIPRIWPPLHSIMPPPRTSALVLPLYFTPPPFRLFAGKGGEKLKFFINSRRPVPQILVVCDGVTGRGGVARILGRWGQDAVPANLIALIVMGRRRQLLDRRPGSAATPSLSSTAPALIPTFR